MSDKAYQPVELLIPPEEWTREMITSWRIRKLVIAHGFEDPEHRARRCGLGHTHVLALWCCPDGAHWGKEEGRIV